MTRSYRYALPIIRTQCAVTVVEASIESESALAPSSSSFPPEAGRVDKTPHEFYSCPRIDKRR